MRAVVKKWGNGAPIRNPSNVKAAKIEIGDPVDIREEQGRIIVEPLRLASYELLVDGITPDNLHREAEF